MSAKSEAGPVREEPDENSHDIEVMTQGIDVPVWLGNVEKFVVRVLEELRYSRWELAVVFCGDQYMQSLNRDYRGKDSPTDVLSFAQIEDPSQLPEQGTFFAGDIVISLDTLRENARYFAVPEEEELKRLLIHGILHLGGWDHSDNSLEQEMIALQELILSKLQKESIY